MTERAQNFMNAVWERRNNGADTEPKLVAAILSLVAENTKFYNAQNNMWMVATRGAFETGTRPHHGFADLLYDYLKETQKSNETQISPCARNGS